MWKALHWNGKVVRVTDLIFTGDVEDKLQRLQWKPSLSLWRPLRFCVHVHGVMASESCIDGNRDQALWVATAQSQYSDVTMGTMASQSLAYRLFSELFVSAHIKDNIKAPRHWPLWGEFAGDRWMASNAENVSIWWRHNAACGTIARTHGCVRNDSETHSTGVTGLHSRLRRSCNPVTQSRAFHCHVRSRFYHIHNVYKRNWDGPCLMNLTQNSYS